MIWFDLVIVSTISLLSMSHPKAARLRKTAAPPLKGYALFQLESQRNLLLAETRRQGCQLELLVAKKNGSTVRTRATAIINPLSLPAGLQSDGIPRRNSFAIV
jgi:hypothetical protein